MGEPLPVIRDYELIDEAKDWTYYFDDLNDVRRRIVRDLRLSPDLKILDIGTGDGWFPLALRALLSEGMVVTIELAANEAENAARRARKVHDSGTCFLSMDAYQLGFPAATFDGVGTFLAIQDICASADDLDRLTGQVARVLKPNGFIVVATVTPEDAETQSQKTGIELYQYIRAGYFSKAEITAALKANGFEVEPFRFYHTGVNLSPESALEFVKFQCSWWVDTFQMPTVDWRTAWGEFGPRIEALGGAEVDAKITVVLAHKNE
jgi:ubiquinone/menaquinone biosynthesis C-methylase UbiE